MDGFLTNSVDTEAFWSFDGSLTTPPCTEGIKWTVLKQIQSISPTQLARFTSQWAGDNTFAGGNGNNRAVQPRNGRDVYQRGEVTEEVRSRKAAIITLSVLLGVFAASCLLMICPLTLQSAIIGFIGCFAIFRAVKKSRENKVTTGAAQADNADVAIKKANEIE